ncbi:MAG TPA: SRPBCC family protein [Amaricoccus sp.]|uniref:SRPBCC family protein n=1 Tax=Amaricoccus sp. TaxID=1872485 RepID=UPI002C62F77F|nr:SRPBCC family protein [Amaricoccus sp.]HMQ91928.1 SRPBCC family protein [Amaricoccus sp.]HMR51569.1 SRPBCC family protein [Amaricoccus sp.]HMR59035.1 SRPBCC family protein [Amaricoccus sp.]HMT98545.1 SRPBCC family protein [Amaricoccus sp.]
MTELAGLDAYGVLTEPATLKLERLLPGPIERVWAYLTDSDLRRQWLASGEMAMDVGAPVELVWRNDELTDPPGSRPDGFSGEHRMISRITELDPPRRLAISWDGTGDVSFELEPRGEEVLLTLVHRRIAQRPMRLMIGAGWHAHLDILAARLSGREPEPFWDGWTRLRDEYDRRLPD